MLRFGVIGYGLFGRWHARCLAATDGAELVAIATRSIANANAARDDHPRCRVGLDWRELVTARDIDAVSIVAPNHLHAEMAIAALDAGKHVLVEKPLATTIADCERVVAAVERNRGLLSVGHELRFSTQWGRIKALVDQGAIGRPTYANLSLFRFPYRPGSEGWRYDPDRVGSWILEEPVHFFDLVMWYLESLGPPRTVRATGTPATASGLHAGFTSWLGFEGGAFATITQSLSGFGHHLVLELTGDDGAIRSTWSAEDARGHEIRADLRLKRGAGEPERLPLERTGEIYELATEIAATVAAFGAGRSLIPAVDGRRAVRVCLEAERAVREGGTVALDW